MTPWEEGFDSFITQLLDQQLKGVQHEQPTEPRTEPTPDGRKNQPISQ